MLKKVLLLFLLTCPVASALAQASAVPAPSNPPAASTLAGRNDTVRAISSLFDRRRSGGHNWLYVAGGGLLGLARVLASPNTTTVGGYQTHSEVDAGAATVFGLGFLAAPAAFGVSKLVRFSEQRETEVINAYIATHRLPGDIAHHLRRKDFDAPKK